MAQAAVSLEPAPAQSGSHLPDSMTDLCRAAGLVPMKTERIGQADWLVVSPDDRLHVLMTGADDILRRLAKVADIADVRMVAALPGALGRSVLRRDLFPGADLCLADAGTLTRPAMSALLDVTAQAQVTDHYTPAPWAGLLANIPAYAAYSSAPTWARAVIAALAQDAGRVLSDAQFSRSFGEAVPNNLVFSSCADVTVLNIRSACYAPIGFDLASAVLWSLEQGGRMGAEAWASALHEARSHAVTAPGLDDILARFVDLVSLRCLWLLRQRCAGDDTLEQVAVTRFLEFALGARIEAAALCHAWQNERGPA